MPYGKHSVESQQVQVWKVRLPLPEEEVRRLNDSLSFDERERSGKFRFLQDRWKYVSARGALRTILGFYLDERPDLLRFGYGNYGKPFLAHPQASGGISFNVSHCNDMAVIGVAWHRRIGIDIETLRDFTDLGEIAEQHFNEEERSAIGSAENEAKIVLFFHAWTRREAVAKARGLDLSAALSEPAFPFYPPGSRVQIEQDGSTWSLQDLQLGPTRAGAVCVDGENCDVTFRDFDSLLSQDIDIGISSD